MDLVEAKYGQKLACEFDKRIVSDLAKKLNEKYGINFSFEEAGNSGNKWLYDSLTSFLGESLGEDFVTIFNQNNLNYLKLRLTGGFSGLDGGSREEGSEGKSDLEERIQTT